MQSRPDGSLHQLLFARVDLASLAVFRIVFGLLMAFACLRFLAKGWVREFLVEPKFHFPYAGFEWVRPLPDFWMHAHFVALVVLALCVAAGLFYRVSSALFCLGFTYAELIDKTNYLNHYYLITLVSGLMVFMPLHREWSLDVLRNPALRAATAPAWTLNLLRFQVGIVWLFAGLAKLNADWLLHAQPLRIWLNARSDMPLVGPWLAEPWVAFAASWFGAAYDLSIVFVLLHRRTRTVGFVLVLVFHVLTAILFPTIGMFPWVMIVASLLFLEPDWPRRWLTAPAAVAASHSPTQAGWQRPALGWLVAAYAAVQIALPLRQHFTGGHSGWDYRGYNFAWNVMLVEKTGHVEIWAADPTSGKRWRLDLRTYLNARQSTYMALDPEMCGALVRKLADDLSPTGGAAPAPVAIRATVWASLNGRPSQMMATVSSTRDQPKALIAITPLERAARDPRPPD